MANLIKIKMLNGRENTMALIESAISMICAFVPAQYNTACSKASDATTRQVGVRQLDDNTESKANTFVINEARELVGDKVLAGGGALYFGYQLAHGQGVGFETDSPILCDKIQGNYNQTGYSLTLKWNFK